jgi:CHAD domain-containing protein
MTTVNPSVLIQGHLEALLGHLPGTFNGDVDSVHQARVATRRIREILPLIGDGRPEGFVKKIRDAGRALGRVRELDVMSSLLDAVGGRVAAAAGIAAIARRNLAERHRSERRAMVKALERLDLEVLCDALAHRRGMVEWSRIPVALIRRPEWVGTLWARIESRSRDAADMVRRAPGVYFPNRAHRARVAVKKLRYSVEVAFDTGVWRPETVLKDLRRIQGILGDMHDVQVLLDALDDLLPGHAGSAELAALKELLDSDLDRYQAEYSKRRDRVFAIADVCARAAAEDRAGWSPRRTLVAASVIAAPLVMFGSRHVIRRSGAGPAASPHAPSRADDERDADALRPGHTVLTRPR